MAQKNSVKLVLDNQNLTKEKRVETVSRMSALEKKYADLVRQSSIRVNYVSFKIYSSVYSVFLYVYSQAIVRSIKIIYCIWQRRIKLSKMPTSLSLRWICAGKRSSKKISSLRSTCSNLFTNITSMEQYTVKPFLSGTIGTGGLPNEKFSG